MLFAARLTNWRSRACADRSTQIDKVSAENALDEDAVSQTGNPQLDGMVAFTVHNESQPLLEKMNHLHHHLEHQLSGALLGVITNWVTVITVHACTLLW